MSASATAHQGCATIALPHQAETISAGIIGLFPTSAAVEVNVPSVSRSSFTAMRAFVAAAALLSIVSCAGSAAVAQSRLGATDGSRPLEPPSPASDRSAQQRAETIAQRLLAQARADRAGGDTVLAQRQLESLIGRYPDTASAEAARRELYEIYASRTAIAGARAPSGAAPPSATTPEARPAWRTTVVDPRRLQDELRYSTGDRIFFAAGATEPDDRAEPLIRAQAAWLLARPGTEAVIEGHADDAPPGAPATWEERLSAERASAIRNRLIAQGVEPWRLRIAARGATDPVALCTDQACAAQNRRVVVMVGVRQSHPASESQRPDPRSAMPRDIRR